MPEFVCIKGCGRTVSVRGSVCDVCAGVEIVRQEMGNPLKVRSKKTCTKCGETKSSTEFREKRGYKGSKSGLYCWCRKCEREAKRLRKRSPLKGRKAKATDSKTCIDCKGEFKPTSNVQKKCDECKLQRKRKIAEGEWLKEKKNRNQGEGKSVKTQNDGNEALDFKAEVVQVIRVTAKRPDGVIAGEQLWSFSGEKLAQLR